MMSIVEINSIYAPEMSAAGCGKCICRECLQWWKQSCPHRSCFDDRRAKENPYITAHGGELRKGWTNWENDQNHWCRGGTCYMASGCESYVHYEGQQVKECLLSNVRVYQDGTIDCNIVDSIGCKECYRRFIEKEDEDAVRTIQPAKR